MTNREWFAIVFVAGFLAVIAANVTYDILR